MNEKHSRLFSIIVLLSDGKKQTYKQLAEELFVSKKTIYRDIMDLSVHYPLVSYYGRNGGVELLGTEYILRIALDKIEIEMLIKILEERNLHSPTDKLYILIRKIKIIFGIKTEVRNDH